LFKHTSRGSPTGIESFAKFFALALETIRDLHGSAIDRLLVASPAEVSGVFFDRLNLLLDLLHNWCNSLVIGLNLLLATSAPGVVDSWLGSVVGLLRSSCGS